MKACIRSVYGSPDVLRISDVKTPAPADDEVLVRVAASSNDRGAWHMMTGMPLAMRPVVGLRAPKVQVMGRAFAGVVTAAGAKATRFSPGDEVFGTTGTGCWAEYAVAPERLLAPMPENVTAEQAGTVGVSGTTALQAVRLAGVRAGQRVMVIGAGGGVGSFAVQIAKASGASVTGVCGASKRDLVTKLGADEVIDYAVEEIDARGARYDVVIDTAGNRPFALVRRALRPGGSLVLVGGENHTGKVLQGFHKAWFAPLVGVFAGRRMRPVIAKENAEDLAEVGRLMTSGAVTPAIVRTFTLDDARASMEYLAEGHPAGKVVLTIS